MFPRYANLSRRIGLTFALALVGYTATLHAVGTSLAKTDPGLSLRISPDNASALGERAQRLIVDAAGDRRNQDQVVMLGRRAITLDATVVPAVVALGLNADAEGNSNRAVRLMRYSQGLSRRDIPTQLYLVESAVARGDVAEALRHYDVVLRTSDTAPSLLFPILRNAIAEAPLRHALAATLRKRPAWAEHFVLEVSAYGPDFHAVALLFAELRSRGFALPTNADNALIENLVAKGELPTAWRYYTTVHPGTDPSRLRDSEFRGSQAAGTLFEWALGTDEGVSASMGTGGRSEGLEFSTAATSAGFIARQLLVLSAGAYRLSTMATGIAQDRGSGPYWELACLDGRIAGTLEIGSTGGGRTMFTQTIIVPPNCPSQWLRLVARPSDDVRGTTGQIAKVSIERIR